MNKLTFNLSLLSTILILVNISFAQINDFNLSDYKLPDLERSTLDVNFNLSGRNNAYSIFNQSSQNFDENNSNQYDGNLDVRYDHYLNNRKHQRATNLDVYFSSFFSTRKEDAMKTNQNTYINPAFYFKRDDRHYFKPNAFFELNTIFNYRYFRDNRFYIDSNNGSEIKDHVQLQNLLAYLPLAIGMGRIEQVQDARQAVYIFDALSEAGCISANKTKEEIIEFAELISTLKNKRFFDFRIRRIAEIESIDSFLLAQNYLTNSDATYFTTLSDMWNFGNRPIRHSGTRFSVGISPGYQISDYENPSGNINFYQDHNYRSFLLQGNFAFQHEKPINLLWQNSIDLFGVVGLNNGKINYRTLDKENRVVIPGVQLAFFHSIGFYPNTRTDIQFSYSLKFGNTFDKTDIQKEIIGVKGIGFNASTNLSINYFVSPKFSFRISSSFNYLRQNSEDRVVFDFRNITGNIYLQDNSLYYDNTYYEKNISNRFSVRLIYSLF